MKKALLLVPIVLLFITSCTFEKGELPVAQFKCDSTVHYHPTIDSIMVHSCTTAGCHLHGGTGNGDFTTYTGLKSKVDNGSLMNRVVVLKNMPAAAPLSDADINKIHCWIIQGGLNN
jgi:hypothetical protein